MPTVGTIGAFKLDYPRNQILRAGLETLGWQVCAMPLPMQYSTLRKLLPLWRSMWQARATCDAFLLAEFNQLLGPFAILFGRLLGRPVAVDYLIGLYESGVLDRENLPPHAWKARAYRLIDWLNCRCAPAIYTDTAAHREAIAEVVGPAARRVTVVPVGVYAAWWHPRPAAASPGDNRPLRILFFGTYIPFHGVEVILTAAHLLRDDPRFAFELVGRGQTYPAMRAEAERLGLDNVTFEESVRAEMLPARVAEADICLGVFGARFKTDYVVPNKLYQYLALGKPVITAESAAVRKCFTPGEHLLTVPPGDAAALAATLRALADDPAARHRIGAAGAGRVHSAFAPEHVAARLDIQLRALLA